MTAAESLGDITSGLATIDGPALPCGHPRGCLCWYAGEAGEPDEESCGWCHDAEALRARSAVLVGLQVEVDRLKGVETDALAMRNALSTLVHLCEDEAPHLPHCSLALHIDDWPEDAICECWLRDEVLAVPLRALGGDAGRELQAEVERLCRIETAAWEWKQAHEWAEQNPGKILSSVMSAEEVAEVMRCYFDKQMALLAALEGHT